MDEDVVKPSLPRTITRESLKNGSLLRALRATPGVNLRSDEQVQASLRDILEARPPGAPVWVFGYGSLMWNPSFDFAERLQATLHGWQRRFCLLLRGGRGTPEQPGLMLALDAGGSTAGVAFRLAEEAVEEELQLIWMREMMGTGYLAAWVTVEMAQGPVAAITFIADPASDIYRPGLGDEESAARIAIAHGPLGSNAEYLAQTVAQLDEMGLHDEALERLRVLVGERA